MLTVVLAVSAVAAPWLYGGFIAFVLVLLALDLGVFHRRAHAPTMKESVGWTAFWVVLALCIAGAVYLLYQTHTLGLGLDVPVVGSPDQTTTLSGFEAAKLYVTAYLVEKSLSMDNVFVIAMIFASLGIPTKYQHRVLFWGIVGALVMRGAMIAVGAAVVASVSWIVYVFGGLLILSAIKMALHRGEMTDVRDNRVVKLVGRVLPVSHELEGQRLISRVGGRWHATPLLVALLVVEASDLMFAVDSIPAVFAITADPFLVFTSNIMALLGLRSLYFCLASAMGAFRYLKVALIGVLLFVGVKMCLIHTPWKVPPEIALSVVLGLLASGAGASLIASQSRVTLEGALVVWRGSRTLRRMCVLTLGSLVIIVGLVISPLPGPGLTVLGPLGLGILASEFLWARRIARQAVRHEKGMRALIERTLGRVSRLWIVPVVLWFWGSAWLLSERSPIGPAIVWTLAFPAFTPLCYMIYRWWAARRDRSTPAGGEP